MSTAHRSTLREIMVLAWRVYRSRHIPGCNVTTFADALRNAWTFIKGRALPPVVGPILQLRTMVQSPIRRSLTGQPYAFDRAYRAGRFTSRLGA